MNLKPNKFFLILVVILVLMIICVSLCGSLGKFIFIDSESIITAKLYCDIYIYLELPTLISIICTGIGLGVAGCVMQTVLQNSLADPSILGVSTSSSFFALLGLLVFGVTPFLPINLIMFIGSLLGAVLVLIVLFLFSMIIQNGRLVGVLLAGVALSAMFGAFMTLMLNYMSIISLKSSISWMYGSVDSVGWAGCVYIVTSMCCGLVCILPLGSKLDILMIGYDNALALGVRLKSVLFVSVIGIALILAGSVAIIGPIGFVGLVSPHIARRVSAAGKQRYLLINSSLVAANIMLIAELISKHLISPYIIPLSAITALMGAPFFLWLLWKNYRVKKI